MSAAASTAPPLAVVPTSSVEPVASPTLDPGAVLEAAAELVATDRPGAIAALDRTVAALLPGHVGGLLALLTRNCPRSPLKVPEGATDPCPTTAELVALGDRARGRSPWRGVGVLGGVERPLVVVATDPDGGAEVAVFAGVPGTEALDPAAGRALQGLCEVLAARYADRAGEAEPGSLLDSIVATQERARAVAEVSEGSRASLLAVASTLRSEHLDDAHARRAALDLVSTAVLELDRAAARERELGTLPVATAFAALAVELRAVTRHGRATIEVVPPAGDVEVPAGLAHATRVVSREVALVLLDRGVDRLRVEWRASDDELVALVRDDGDGEVAAPALTGHGVAERLHEVGADLVVDAVPGWGTTVTVRVPLGPVEAPDPGPLAVLNDREREVLAHVASGLRNRQVAEALTISEHTVKFHVGNILRKLGVATRGEAAALARA